MPNNVSTITSHFVTDPIEKKGLDENFHLVFIMDVIIKILLSGVKIFYLSRKTSFKQI